MKLIVGLGNPGKKYKKTRHNAGFMTVDRIRGSYNLADFKFNRNFNAEVSKGNFDGKDNILAIPQTFMNESGDSVRTILDFYKLTPKDLIIIHDDIDLPLGEFKIARFSGSAGHNGVQDIIDKIGTKEFLRVRIGVANDKLKNPIDPADFVLQNFSDEELKTLEKISDEIILKLKNL
ncbi:MAG TPA: aminoacyl-tRNA hydrolase [Patescibacteria group bacterium]|nr:aminoacyl-tRNA hydrolase [Patescibacteria group bacterium]